MNTTVENNTWHQQPLIWFVISLLVVTMLASFGLLFLAMKNAPELVVENYSNIEEFTNQTRAQDRRANELQLQAKVSVQNGVMTIAMLAANEIRWPDAVVVRTVNSTLLALDRQASFPGAQGHYAGSIELPDNGYDLRIEAPDGSWRLSQRAYGKPATLELSAFRP
jgi:hypothetical protein